MLLLSLLIVKISLNLIKNPIPSAYTVLYFISLIYCISVICSIMPLKKKYLKGISSIMLILMIYMIVFGLIFVNETYFNQTIQMIVEFATYIFVVILTSIFIIVKKREIEFVKLVFWIITIFIFICYISNFDNFEGIKHIGDIFSYSSRYRNSYGFEHANQLGNMCLCAIIFSVIYLKTDSFVSKKIKYVILASDLLLIQILVSTASRNSLTALCLFICLLIWNKVEHSIQRDSFMRILKVFIFMSLIILFIVNIQNGHIEDIILQARGLNFTINIPLLFNSHRLLIGLGFINSGLFGNHSLGLNTFFIDNYYLYVLMSTGIIGIMMISYILFNILMKIKKNNIIKSKQSLAIDVYIVFLYTGIFENCVIYPAFVSCYVISIWLISLCVRRTEESLDYFKE